MYTHPNYSPIKAIALLALIFCFGCKPEEKIIETQIAITVNLQSSLAGKQIANGTEVKLSDGKNNQYGFSENGNVIFKYTIINGQTIDFEITAEENEGHENAAFLFSTNIDKNIILSMVAKDWKADVNFNTKIGSATAPNINYAITTNLDNKTGITNEQGQGNTNLELLTNEYNEPQITPTQFKFTGTGIKEMNYDRSIIPKVVNNFDFDLTKQMYQHAFTVSTVSNLPSKTPLLTTANGTYDYGEGSKNFSPNTGVINFESEDETEDITVSVSNIPGHNNGSTIVQNTGSALKNGQTITLTLEGIMYNITQPMYVTNNNQALNGVTITYTIDGKNGNVTTGTNGKTNIVVNNTSTDDNNIPLTNYPVEVTLTKDGYQQKQETFSATVGNNNERTVSMNKNQFVIKGTGNPNGANTKVWRAGTGTAIISTDVANGNYQGNYENATLTLPVDSIVHTASGYIKQKTENTTLQPGDNVFNFTLVPEPSNYNTNIQGKVLTLTKERIRNKEDALIIENVSGQKFYFDLDANGEFSGTITTNQTNEQVKIYWNTTTMPDIDKNTISINKHNQTYPKNRIINSYFGPKDDTNIINVDVSKLDDDYLRIYAGEKTMVNDPSLQWAIREGSSNYWVETPLRPYVYTLLPDGITTISSSDQTNMTNAVNNARNILYHTETGWTVPVNETQAGTNFGNTPTGLWLMKQRPLGGYWNVPYNIIGGLPNTMEGGEAQVDAPVHTETAYAEIIGPWMRDNQAGTVNYSYNWNNGSPTLTPLGNAHMTITTEFLPGSGKTTK